MNSITCIASSLFLWVFLFNTNPSKDSINHSFDFPYDLESPEVTFNLPEPLEEISGLGLSSDGSYLVSNNDEEGKIFYINTQTGAVENTVEFWKEGDYEGIEKIGETIYVVKSTGTIYEVNHLTADQPAVNKYNFFLTKDNDVEALGYDAKNNRLLLGCKGIAGNGDNFNRKKAIYAFDLATKTLQEKPAFLFSIQDICTYLGHCSMEEHTLQKLQIQFDPNSEDFNFNPSALAIHPKTGHIYITSSKGKLILVLSETGKILHIEKLKKKIHQQPEGICFDKDGTLWMSSEKKKESPAKVYKFSMQ